jgi:hypothetical protein
LLWPTPEAKNHIGYQVANGRMYLRLGTFADHWTRKDDLLSLQARSTVRHGRRSNGRSYLPLNPRFTEWLMGWPIGWTDLEPVAMAYFHWLLRMRGELLLRH